MSAWGCPHEVRDKCLKLQSIPCNPGMKGCVLAGRYHFAGAEEKNRRRLEKKARSAANEPGAGTEES